MSEATTSTLPAVKLPMDILEIQRILPHRYPFLLIDRVTELERRQRIVALKNVSVNEPHFAGHFPSFPIMPGVLVVEAMAQAGGLLLLIEFEDRDAKLLLFTGIESAKFRRPIVPGDQLRLEVSVLSWTRRGGRMDGKAYIGDKLACEAIITCQLIDRSRMTASAPAQDNA